jgi:GntR family transcriptional regulator, transcriptional repressor for pyruvate dehydrogenase complex
VTVTGEEFRRYEQLRAHAYVAEQLRRLIALRVAGAGRALPPERELARLFGVGRATVQKAIDELEAEGLIERRRGRTGGTFVRTRSGGEGPAAEVLSVFRNERRLVEEALDYRSELEPGVAAAAAAARSESDLVVLARAARLAAASGDDAEFMEHDTDFHLRIARATGNRFFSASVEQLRLAVNDALAALPDSAHWHARSAAEHDEILAAIERRDAAGARRAMRAHVTHTARRVRALLAAPAEVI